MRDTYVRIERIKFLKFTLGDLEKKKERAILSANIPALVLLREKIKKVKKLLDEEKEDMK